LVLVCTKFVSQENFL